MKPPASRRWLAATLVALAAQWTLVGTARTHSPSGLVEDVEGAFARIEVRGEHLTARANGLIPEPSYRATIGNGFGFLNHFQGIQRLAGNYVVLSGSNPRAAVAELFIVRLGDTGHVVARIAVDQHMWHAGGLSTAETILAVPVHVRAPRNAKVVFYDVSDPTNPRRLPVEIARPGRKASAVALTRLSNGHFLAAVLSALDGLPRRLDFYLSRQPMLEAGFHPAPAAWHVSEVRARPGQARTFSYFQGINFIRQADGRLFLVGFHNSFLAPSFLPGRDYADLYEVAFPAGTVDATSPVLAHPEVIKVANRHLRCANGYCNLDAAAGLFVDPDTRSLSVYATPGWLHGDTVKVTVYKSP